jgi:hypothetical protein
MAVSVVIAGLIAFRVYHDHDQGITSFVAFGEDDPITAQYGGERHFP